MQSPESLFIIAGNGRYPFLLCEEARKAGVRNLVVAAFEGETDPDLARLVDRITWHKVGQLGAVLKAARQSGASHGMMVGQIAPKNLFDLRPDLKALLLLAKIKERNAETLFGELANQMRQVGVEVLPATTFLDDHLAGCGHLAGPKMKPREITDVAFGFRIAKEVSRLDIGQTVVVKNGSVLAVEAWEGTNEAIARGGALGKSAATMVKVSKPNQDMRFDVPVIGPLTLENAARAKLRTIGIEAGCTLILDRPLVARLADQYRISIFGIQS